MKAIKKTIYTLNVNSYSEKITALTYPFIRDYAEKIGAAFHIIKDRKFPDWPITYEKLQIYELGQENDWSIYVDSDALIHPDTIDFTTLLKKDTVCHFGKDLAGNRWKYDNYFLRDGRNISSCNWFTISSDWCIDLWKPTEQTFGEVLAQIHPVLAEQKAGILAPHLVDDYVLSRNIAKYGLKFTTCKDILDDVDCGNPGKDNYFFHEYLVPEERKVSLIKERLKLWGLAPWYFDIPEIVTKGAF